MNRAVILRLETYLMHLQELKAYGRATVTSAELASVTDISSSRVRQDLISLQGIGKPRSGYSINELELLLYSALDLLNEKAMALVGYGNLGRALAHSGIWEHAGFSLKAIFDNDRSIVGADAQGLTVRHLSELPGVVKSEKIVSACLTVPASAAQSVANLLISAGVKGIWNFAPTEVKAPAGVVIENQKLEQGLMTLSYMLKLRSISEHI